MDFRFWRKHTRSGEKITRAIERGLEMKIPAIIVSASGSEDVKESLSANGEDGRLARLAEAGIPYFSVLTNPTMAGVTASGVFGRCYSSEPKAPIGFAGRRVIKETTRVDLPEGFRL